MSDFLLVNVQNEQRLYAFDTEKEKRSAYGNAILNCGLTEEHLEWLLTTTVREPQKPLVPFDATAEQIAEAQAVYDDALAQNERILEENATAKCFLDGDFSLGAMEWLENTFNRVMKGAKATSVVLTLTETN